MPPDLKGADALLMIGSSERCANLFYATRFRAPASFVFLWTPNQKIMLANNLEIDRARDQASVDRVLSYTQYEQQAKERGQERPNSNAVLLELLRDLGLAKLQVPADFPLGTADFLRGEGIELAIATEPLFPQRNIKDATEIENVRRAMRATEAGMETAIEGLHAADVRDGVLFLNGDVLTSERLRRMVHQTLMDCDSIGEHTIIAGGDQGCDPHQVGFGPLHAGETIIIDIFPRDEASGYYGDLTRTVCKGPASKPLQHLYETVLAAQQLGLDHIHPGAEGHLIHESIQRFFDDAGYETGEKDSYMQGYIHSTGHGLGLEIHEGPRIGPRGDVLESGHVVTMEPGLYYRGLGGVRIEDTVVVCKDGYENLCRLPKVLEV
ncbi:MAG: aminopeptidase P family protein [Gemmatimonadetes bacterium]|nr:aminopeptidase P family protein [Gemmatimonadota bacterium]